MRDLLKIFVLVFVIFTAISIGIISGYESRKAEDAWFEECERHKPRYECVYLRSQM